MKHALTTIAPAAALAAIAALTACVEPYPNRIPQRTTPTIPIPPPASSAPPAPPTTEPPMPVPTSPDQPADQPPVQGTFIGTLRGGIMAIGGESTGWMLEGPGDQGRARGLDVDVSQVRDRAQELEGQSVVIRGHIEERRYVERGTVNVLIAQSINPQGQ